MKSKFILALVASFSLTATFANAASQNLCDSLTGTWQGHFVLKDKNVCEKLKGCYHTVKAEVAQLNGGIFQLDIKPSAGQGGILHGTCENSKIKISELPNTYTKLEHRGSIIFVRHENDDLFAFLTHV